jgi:hypothetical protein
MTSATPWKLPAVRALLQFIYAAEGNYTSVNRGRAGDTPGGLPRLTSMTIGEVKKEQAAERLFAVGAPQFIPSTLLIAQAAAGLSDVAPFSPENQDRLATALLLGSKRPALASYLTGKSSNLDAAQTDMAKEWASVPLPSGRGYYDGDSAGNRATQKTTAVRTALMAARAGITEEQPESPKLAVPAQQPIAKAVSKLVTISGMIGPVKRPHDFGFKAGDSHLIMNDRAESLTAWSFDGERLWCIPAMARGQGRDTDWRNRGTDTPPGIYRLGQLYDDVGRVGLNPPYSKTFLEYGFQFYDMVELENQEVRYGRAGVGMHGGGTALGWPAAWAPKQPLVSTLGCIRIANIDLVEKIMPLYKKGACFVSVFQEAP